MDLAAYSHSFAPRAIASAAVLLASCSQPSSAPSGAAIALVGTWAEIVSSQPANSSDGRQVIERLPDGRFKLVFVRTHTSRPPCTGLWSVSEGGDVYSMTFLSTDCFSQSTDAPAKGAQLQFELLSAEPARLKFRVPAGSRFAPWQARLEGGIE